MHLYDIAEEDIKKDKLGYQNYVDELYQLIKQAFEDRKSLNIGIAGSWGDGKTTAIKMCLAKLKMCHKDKYTMREFLHKPLNINRFDFYFNFVLLGLAIACLINYPFMQSHYKEAIFALLIIIWVNYKGINQIRSWFVNLLNKENYSEIWFSPWSCTDNKHIMSEYLKAIAQASGSGYNLIPRLLLKYSKILVGSNFDNILSPTSNLSQLKSEICERLKNSNQKILVIIDDLDRIQCDEIYNVLKLIGSVANFPNVINILAYDKPYIVEELKRCIPSSFEENKASKYLEKIINIECPLPKIEDITLKEYLFTHLDKMIEVKND